MALILSGDTGPSFVQDAAMPAGSILQVVSATKTDTSSTGSSTFSDITGLSVTITPLSSSSKFLILGAINVSWQQSVSKAGVRLVRDSTAIAIADTAGSRARTTAAAYVDTGNFSPECLSVTHLDSPATASAITYKWQLSSLDNAGTIYVNRAFTDTDSSITPRAVSSITVMEIAG